MTGAVHRMKRWRLKSFGVALMTTACGLLFGRMTTIRARVTCKRCLKRSRGKGRGR